MIRAALIAALLLPLPALAVCSEYPCAHVAHVVTGALVGYGVTKLVGPKSAFVTVAALAIARETYDKHHGKNFQRQDVLTRVLGGGIGIYIAKEF